MRTRLVVLSLVAGCVTLTFSLLQGQERTPEPGSAPAAAPAPQPTAPTAPLAPPRDLSQLSKLQQQMLFTAQRGADWLFRMHGVKGRFLPGYNPALKQPLEGDNFLHQAGAAAALAQAARFIGEERYAARATQALLALLEDTATDPTDSLSRYTTLPPVVVNRVGAAGQLVLAIHDLPAPQKDLADRAEELTRYIARSAQADGSLRYQFGDGFAKPDEGMNVYPGLGLAALARSHRARPAPWKLDLVRKALPVYRAWWKQQRSTDFVPRQSEAFAEAYLACRDRTLADFVFEMNDWVCSLQYTQIDPRRMYWYGGFMSWRDNRPIESEPLVHGAALAEGLVQAARIAREVGDVERFTRYSEATERCLQFLATLQYTEAGTQHFVAWYRPQLVGGFHASTQDGNLRLDYNQRAVAVLLGYLEHIATAGKSGR
ncbi:MAG: hypothetical protein U0840_02570 [Gemmataceae bacterium]